VCVLFGAVAEAKVYKSYDDVLKSADKAEIAAMQAALERAGYGGDTLMSATQCGHVAPVNTQARMARQDLRAPTGSTGGN